MREMPLMSFMRSPSPVSERAVLIEIRTNVTPKTDNDSLLLERDNRDVGNKKCIVYHSLFSRKNRRDGVCLVAIIYVKGLKMESC